MHDYNDLEQVKGVKEGDKEVLGNYVNKEAQGFVQQTKKLYRTAHIWLTEQGVLLQTGEVSTRLYQKPELQRLAAQDFLRLGRPSEHIEWAYYYLYHGPTAARILENKYEFDSALLPGEGVTEEDRHPAENPRQAYCVLALGLEGCPATSKTQAAIASTITPSAGTISLDVNPEGLATKYMIQYGTTEAYGKTTTATAVANENGEQSETVTLSGLEECTTYHYQAEAENAGNEGKPGLGGDKTFQTEGRCPASSIASQDTSACAGFTSGTVDCWGEDSDGQLGDGRTELEALPGEVTKLTGVSEISGRGQPCALLSSGSIDCWGGKSGDVPVTVTGITSATSVDTAVGQGSEGAHACASLKSGAVECWGSDVGGMLGNGKSSGSYSSPVAASGITNAVNVSVGGSASCAVLSTGHIDCWGEVGIDWAEIVNTEEGSSVPVEIAGISTAKQVSVGDATACAVLSDGHIECWGYGENGLLGTGGLNGPEMCGEDYCSRTPREVTGISDASSVSVPAGELGAPCAVLTTGSLKCWGSGSHGGLGNGEKEEKTGTPVTVSGIKTATAVATGGNFGATCALLSGGTVDCWGMNLHGALGYKAHESEEVVATPVEVAGI